MASQPPQPSPSSHQRASSPSPSSPPETRRPSIPHSTTSVEDSQTLLLHTPPPSTPAETSRNHASNPTRQPSEPADQTPRPRPPPRSRTHNEPLQCWICLADSTDPLPTTVNASSPSSPTPASQTPTRWTHPCPCALVAHESCLLTWVSSQESSPIKCPQCLSPITISRPFSPLTSAVRAAERVWERAVTPLFAVGLVDGVILGAVGHGLFTVYAIFGRRDAEMLLFGMAGPRWGQMSWRWLCSLPLIPVALVLSRTTIADGLFPVLPILYFMQKAPTREAKSLWPPSVAMVIAGLPYVRGIYYGIRRKVFAEREKRWVREMQPLLDEGEGEAGARAGAGEAEGREQGGNGNFWDGVNFELGLEVEIVEDGERIPDAGPQDAPAENLPPPGQNAIQQNQAPNPPPAPPAPQQARPPRDNPNGITLSLFQLASTLTGALLFPSIASVAGSLLYFTLPKSWTVPPTLSKSSYWTTSPSSWGRSNNGCQTGLLQSPFGRSVVGGCLFVVLKDSLGLYAKWRMARDHKRRKVVDYDPEKRQAGGARAGSGEG